MATGFAIFGAITGAIGALNMSRQLVNSIIHHASDWKRAGEHIIDISDSFEAFIFRLQTWSAGVWKIDEEFTDEVGKAYWGDKGWASVAIQLSHIDRLANELRTVLEKAVHPREIAKLRQSSQIGLVDVRKSEARAEYHDLSDSRAVGVSKLQELATLVGKAPTFKEKARLVFNGHDTLLDRVNSLNERFHLLERDAKRLFHVMYPTVPRGISQQGKLSAAQGTQLLKFVRTTMADSEILFHTCNNFATAAVTTAGAATSSQPKATSSKLEIDLLTKEIPHPSGNERSCFKRKYHLILPRPAMHEDLEVLAEGPFVYPKTRSGAPVAGRPPPPLQDIPHFENACERTRRGFQTYFKGDGARDPPSGDLLLFRLSPPPEPLKPRSAQTTRLYDLLGEIQGASALSASERFPLAEKYNLAFKIAECGLLLIGTPWRSSWLSSMSSKNVQRLSKPAWGRRRRFVLEFGDRERERPPKFEPHLVRIGALLAQIGMGRPVDSVQKKAPSREPLLMVPTASSQRQKPTPIPLIEVGDRVRCIMGPSYSNAVLFCLRESSEEKWITFQGPGATTDMGTAYKSLLERFYVHVYTPLGKSRDICNEDRWSH